MKTETKRSNVLLWASLILFTIEFLIIVGWYWIFGDRAGDASLTISRYVGLGAWSSLLFCIYNVAIATMLFYYILTSAKIRSFLWRFLMCAFLVTFIALSVSPHLPDESMPAQIHIFFAGSMFVIMSLIGIYTLLSSESKTTRILSLLFIIYAVFFCVLDMIKPDFFMNNVFWYESAYLYAFFALLIHSNRLQEKAADIEVRG